MISPRLHLSRRELFGVAVATSSAYAALPVSGTRSQAMAEARAALERECKAFSQGDWQGYYDSLRPFREALWARVKAAFDNPFPSLLNPAEKAPLVPLLGRQGCYYISHQLQEVSVGHAGGPGLLPDVINGSPAIPIIAAASAWLRNQGIDLLFVPGPTPPHIDPVGLVEDAKLLPAHGIVAPHARAVLLRLIEKDVEIVDVLPALLEAKRRGTGGLVLMTDTHWGPSAHRIAAQRVAERLQRLPLVKRSLSRAALYTDTELTYDAPASLMNYLTLEKRQEVDPLRKITCRVVNSQDGQPLKPAANAPILVIGDSFTDYGVPPGGAFASWLSRYVNQTVGLLRFDGHTDHAFKEMARNPEILKSVQTVVWINNQGSFTTPYVSGWPTAWKIPPASPRKG